MTVGIYKIENKTNGKVYVGQSINIERRWRQHINSSFNEKDDSNTELHRTIKKHSLNHFKWEILEECRVEELDEKEKFWIKELNSISPYGYNYSYGGQGEGSGKFLKLNDELLNQIINDLQNSELTVKEIANKFKLTHQMIYNIKNGKSWVRDDLIYPLRNRYVGLKRKVKSYYCEYCGKEKSQNAEMCKECYDIYQQTVERPEPLDLMEMVFKEGFSAVGRKYEVSDNAIRKWCKSYGLPSKIEEVKQWWLNYNDIVVKEKRKVTQGSVLQIDKETNEVIATFSSAVAAAESLGNRDYNKHISSVCTGKRKTAYGYKWRRIQE